MGWPRAPPPPLQVAMSPLTLITGTWLINTSAFDRCAFQYCFSVSHERQERTFTELAPTVVNIRWLVATDGRAITATCLDNIPPDNIRPSNRRRSCSGLKFRNLGGRRYKLMLEGWEDLITGVLMTAHRDDTTGWPSIGRERLV